MKKSTSESDSSMGFLYNAFKLGGQTASDIMKSQHVTNFLGLPSQTRSDPAEDSSDESAQPIEDPEFVSIGCRGVIVFPCAIIRPSSKAEPRTIHIHMYTKEVRVYSDSTFKTYSCDDFVHCSRGAEATVYMETKAYLRLRPRRYRFPTSADATRFLSSIEYLKEYGACLRGAFDHADRSQQGVITSVSLSGALRSLDLPTEPTVLSRMLTCNNTEEQIDSGNTPAVDSTVENSINNTSSKYAVDYQSFCAILFGVSVLSTRECFEVWLHKAITKPAVAVPASHTETAVAPSTHGASPRDGMSPRLTEDVLLIEGEHRVHVINNVRWVIGRGRHYASSTLGSLNVTNYRVIISSATFKHISLDHQSRFALPAFFHTINIPLNLIAKIAIVSSHHHQQPKRCFDLHLKDQRCVRIFLLTLDATEAAIEGLTHFLHKVCFSGARTQLFAYKFGRRYDIDGWKFSDIRRDYERLGLTKNSDFQVYDNSSWKLCDTYPPHLVFPATVDETLLQAAAGYRSRKRLPAVTYYHSATQRVLARSSQPMLGIVQTTSKPDAQLLNYFRLTGSQSVDWPSMTCILDARSQIAAAVNMAAGKGTEDISSYTEAQLIFCNIENIHVMRQSYAHWGAQLINGSVSENDSHCFAKIEETGWLKHVHAVLAASVLAAEKLHHESYSVLVHCSDGWDRTAQICSLAQIILDPYYRTIEGLATLIEKEWCAFGYKFQDRCGHAEGPLVAPDEKSPVFLQFLDCLHQMVHQCRDAFEYNEAALVFIADHLHSGLFGTFLGNSYRVRHEDLGVAASTQSIWGHLLQSKARRNSDYVMYPHALWPDTAVRSMVIWKRCYCRWNAQCHPVPHGKIAAWEDDWYLVHLRCFYNSLQGRYF